MIQVFKQFFVATVRQEFSAVIGRPDRIDNRLDKVEDKIDDLSNSVAEALENSNQVTDEQLQNHEQRIKKLEQTTT